MKLAILSALLISTPALAHSDLLSPVEKENSQLHCEMSTYMEAARDQVLSGKITYRDFTLQYLCGMETKGLKGTALEADLQECRKHLDSVADEWFANMSREELAKKLEKSFGKHGVKNAKFDKILKKGKAALIAALFDPHKTSTLSGHQKESMSGELASDMEFGPLAKEFRLIELGSAEEKELRAEKYFSEKYYRVIELEGKRYFEPSYGLGEFRLGKIANLDAAKKLFPDAVEVLGSNNATLGSTQRHLRVTAWGKKEVSFRNLAVRRANGQVDGVIQLLEAPAESQNQFDPVRHQMDVGKIKVLQQFIVPGDGKALEMNLMQLRGIPQTDSISGLPITKYTMKATCSIPAAKLPAGANADGPFGDNGGAASAQ